MAGRTGMPNPRNHLSPVQQVLVSADGLEKLMATQQQQLLDSQAALRRSREQEVAQFQEALQLSFQQQLEQTRIALRPTVVWTWKIIAATLALMVLLLALGLVLLKQTNDGLQAAQARLDVTEVSADVQQALQHVDITACGQRPCIRVDKNTPTWKRGKDEYILVDGKAY